ncbi:hypothetical protein [Timonella sp. A28]|uniref:hypothetical protein n=1 Tax=Timonella sp. A28 TaxID=3442640 RepID=UPI003EBFE7E0
MSADLSHTHHGFTPRWTYMAAKNEEESEMAVAQLEDYRVYEETSASELFDFELTDELLAEVGNLDALGDLIRAGEIPNALLADLTQFTGGSDYTPSESE